MLSWFEVVAAQEVADNLDAFNRVLYQLPNHLDWFFNDRAVNDERAVYVIENQNQRVGDIRL